MLFKFVHAVAVIVGGDFRTCSNTHDLYFIVSHAKKSNIEIRILAFVDSSQSEEAGPFDLTFSDQGE